MKYSFKQLATMYSENLSQRFLDVTIPAQTFDPSTYNEYTYHMIKALEEKNDGRFAYTGEEEPTWSK